MAKKTILILLLELFFLSGPMVHAHCPLCTAAIGTAAVSAKYYGLDMTIIGLLAGAFAVSTGLWLGLKLKKQYFRLQLPIIVIASLLLTIVPLRYVSNESIYLPMLFFGSAGSMLNRVYWVDKLFFGSFIGSFITLAAFLLHRTIKKIHGKVLFPYQGIAITIFSLFLSGISLYFIFGV